MVKTYEIYLHFDNKTYIFKMLYAKRNKKKSSFFLLLIDISPSRDKLHKTESKGEKFGMRKTSTNREREYWCERMRDR